VGAALQHFGARVWATLAPKYPDVNVHLYAPLRRTISLEASPAPAPRAPAAISAGNPFLSTATSSSPVVLPSPSAANPGSLTTTADVSAESFEGVAAADHIAAIRRLYMVVNPDKMSQVGLR
jgi:hypothetical protein